jgi:hypothetical protein
MNSQNDIQEPGLPKELVPELYMLLFQNYPLRAVRRVMEISNCRLSDAIATVNTIWTNMRQQFSERIEQEVRVLLVTSDREGAIDHISERTGMSLQDSAAYVDMLGPSIQVHVSKEEAHELLALYKQGKKRDAADRIRATNQVGLAAAVEFLDLLLTMATSDKTSATTRNHSDRSAHSPNLLPSKGRHLALSVRAQIKRTFPRADWEGVGAILSLYGQKGYELETKRVQLAVLQLTQGNPHKLLQMVEAAKEDYRDVLYWASSQH